MKETGTLRSDTRKKEVKSNQEEREREGHTSLATKLNEKKGET